MLNQVIFIVFITYISVCLIINKSGESIGMVFKEALMVFAKKDLTVTSTYKNLVRK